jgi:hypothetical protein
MNRMAGAGLLLPHHPDPNLRGVAYPQLVSQFGEHPLKPPGMSGDFDPHQDRAG